MLAAEEHWKDLAIKLYSFQQENVLCDTVLAADDGRVWAHSIVLAAASPYFCSNFLQMSRHDAKFRFSLKLSGCDSVCIKVVLRFLYTGSLVLPASFRQPQMFAGILQVCEKLGVNATKLNGTLVTFVDFNPYTETGQLPPRELRPHIVTSDAVTDSDFDAVIHSKPVVNGQSKHFAETTEKLCKIPLEEDSLLAIEKEERKTALDSRDIDVKLEMNVFEVSTNCEDSSDSKDRTTIVKENVRSSLVKPICVTLPTVVAASFTTTVNPLTDIAAGVSASELLSTKKKTASSQHNSSVRMATKIRTHSLQKVRKVKVKIRRMHTTDTMKSSFLPDTASNHGIAGRAKCKKGSILCHLCGKRFRWHWDLRNHMEIYQAHLALTCKECGKVLTCTRELHTHEKLHAGHPLHACPTCGKVYRCRSGLMMHLCEHTGQMPYLCDICGAGFKSFFSMGWHKKRLHSTVRPFICKECGKGFIHKVLLRRHLQVHSSEKLHVCHKCGMKFSYQRNLSRHLASHVGDKPHCCGVCGKSFGRIDNMQSHALIHKGERSHACSECQKVFRSALLLKRHLTIHSDENLHTCNVCGKRFTAPIRLKQHMVMHQEKQYKCPLCVRTFSFERFLRSHLRKFHQDTGLTNLPSSG